MRKLLLIGCLLLVPGAQAQQAGQALLTKMLGQADKINYQGTFVYMHDDQLDAMKIIHGVVGGEVKEKLVSLSGEPREVVRDHETVTCVWPHRKLVTVDSASSVHHAIPTIIPKELGSLRQNYSVVAGPVSIIADHECRLLAIKPADQWRYGYELCIDPQTGMLLRSKMIHPGGRLLEEVMFTHLRYLDSVEDINFNFKNNDIDKFTWHKSSQSSVSEKQKLQTQKSWRVAGLPPGFSVSKIGQRIMPTSDEPVHHMVVSDGVASVSIFITKPRKMTDMFEGLRRRGSINAFSRGFNDHQITVLGEVPNATVKMIGASVERYQQ